MSATTLGTQISHTQEGMARLCPSNSVVTQLSGLLVSGGLSAQLRTQEHQGAQALLTLLACRGQAHSNPIPRLAQPLSCNSCHTPPQLLPAKLGASVALEYPTRQEQMGLGLKGMWPLPNVGISRLLQHHT